MAKRVKIPGRLESAETGNIVTGADAVMDDEKGKTQVVINSEVDAAIISLAQGKQDALTFDNAPTEGSPNPVTSAGVYTADKVLSDAIEAILLLIPSAASALNKLVDMQTMNSSIATATASFKGTYNLVSDLHLGVDANHEQIGAALDALSLGADNNDYAFVQVPNSATAPTEIRVTERYKFNGTNWLFEYDLNNSGFTQGQWNAINSGVTSLLVGKLSDLPTNDELTTLLAGKQDNLTFDNVPTAGSPNPVKSGGVYARNNEIVALINALDAAKQDVLTFDNAPVEGSPNPVKSGGVYTAISAVQAAIVALDAEKQNVLTFDSTPTLGSSNPVMSSGIKTELNRIDGNITTLNDLYEALTQSALVIVQPSDTWPVASPATSTIYRVVDRVNTPPQYYSDYMWNGSAMVLMATYNNAIDPRPKKASQNLVTSGGVFDNMGALDVSELNATENPHTIAKYVDLSAALAAVPTDYQKGGMSIKFVQSSDNKYVQYRLMATSWSTTESDWQGIDDEPIAGSNNLIKSGGLFATERGFAADANYSGSFGSPLDVSKIYEIGVIGDIDLTKEYYIQYFRKNVAYIRIVDGEGNNIADVINFIITDGAVVNIGNKFAVYADLDSMENFTAYFNIHLNKHHKFNSQLLPLIRQFSSSETDKFYNNVQPDGTLDKNSLKPVKNSALYTNLVFSPVDGIIIVSETTFTNVVKACVKKAYSVIYDDKKFALNPEKLYFSIIKNNSESISTIFRLRTADNDNYWQSFETSGSPLLETKTYKINLNGCDLILEIDWSLVNGNYEASDLYLNSYIDIQKLNLINLNQEQILKEYIHTLAFDIYSSLNNSILRFVKQKSSGKKILCLGDSITQFGGYEGKRYSDIIADTLGEVVYNAGFGASGLACSEIVENPTTVREARTAFAIPNIAEALATGDWSKQLANAQWLKNHNANDPFLDIVNSVKDIDISTIDIITILGGTNDIGTTFIGQYGNTVRVGISSIVESLLTANPDMNVIFFTPIVRYFGNVNETWDEDLWCQNYRNGANLSFNQLIDEVISGAQDNNVRYCDLYHGLGITKQWIKVNAVDGDGTHLYKAFPIIAEKIVNEILFR